MCNEQKSFVWKPLQIFTKEVNYKSNVGSSPNTSLGPTTLGAYDPRGLRPSGSTDLGMYLAKSFGNELLLNNVVLHSIL